jgi:alkylation response protein AidB-like acyl-CoA dehydrogenase
MTIAMTDEQAALQESIRDWATNAHTVDAVRRLEPGETAGWAPDRLWRGIADVGVLGVALPEEFGGAGCLVADAAAGLEQAAASLVPGPLLPTVLAGLLLARHADPSVAKQILPSLADGSLPAAVALEPGTLRGEELPDGGLRVSGQVDALLGATPASQLVLAVAIPDGVGWITLGPGQADVIVREPLDFSVPLASVALTDVAVPAERRLPTLDTAEVEELAAVLAAAESSGVAGWCLNAARDYAATRRQFGRVIGSFQAVKHICAHMLCRSEEAGVVAWDAARAAGGVPPERQLAAAVAASVALDAGVENAKDCIQVLGGIGFTWEHDAHLYLRRALSLRQWLGGGPRWRRRAAELALAGQRRRLAVELDDSGRGEVRELAARIAALPPVEQRIPLADNGYIAPHWPPPYGLGASARQQLVIDEELESAGVRRPDLVIGGWALPTIIGHGSSEQQDRFVQPTLRGEIIWCQLFSEPEAGSDLAALRTKAEKVDGGWRLTGQKVWTSVAAKADWGICLARTDPDAPQHRGITYFLVDMTAPGIDIRPLRQITGESVFNEVFLDGVFVPDADVVGEVNGGWRLARTTLSEERVALGGSSALGEGGERLLAAYGTMSDATDRLGLDRLGALVSEGTTVALIGLRSTLRRLAAEENGGAPAGSGAESAVLKLIGVRHRQGPGSIAMDGDAGPVAKEMLQNRCLSIAGGTTQILLTLAAERILGLPREPTSSR